MRSGCTSECGDIGVRSFGKFADLYGIGLFAWSSMILILIFKLDRMIDDRQGQMPHKCLLIQYNNNTNNIAMLIKRQISGSQRRHRYTQRKVHPRFTHIQIPTSPPGVTLNISSPLTYYIPIPPYQTKHPTTSIMALSAPSTDVNPYSPQHLQTQTQTPKANQETAQSPNRTRNKHRSNLPQIHSRHRLATRKCTEGPNPLPPRGPTQARPGLHCAQRRRPTPRGVPVCDRERHDPRQRELGAAEAQHRAPVWDLELGYETEDG